MDTEDIYAVFDEIRHDKKRAFLIAYSETGSVTKSAEAAGIVRTHHYHWLKTDTQYKDALSLADHLFSEALESHARSLALKGDTTMTIFLLKGQMPEKYGDKSRVTHDFSGLTSDQLIARAESLFGRTVVEGIIRAIDEVGADQPVVPGPLDS